jgi:radical SAM superfamily enzyme YgiQ (UPF0313 family)
MRVLLVHPSFPYKGRDLFPIGLGYLASVIKDRAEILVIDDPVEPFDAEKVKKFRPDIIGISSTTPSFSRAAEIIGKIRALGIETTLVVGGVHATFRPEDALAAGADIVVRGEGEIAFSKIVGGHDLSTIRGVSYSDNGIKHNPDEKLIEDLDKIPYPAYEFFPIHSYGIMSIVTSRGCPYSCTYCSATRFWRHKVRFRSPKNVIGELEKIVELNHKRIKFMDSTFTLDKERAIKICEGIIEKGLDIIWSCETRADHLDDELLQALSEAGCNLLCIGVDSGSQEILDKSKRRMKVSTIVDAFDKARKYGIKTRAYVTFGLPGENKQSPETTIRLLERIKPGQTLLSLATSYPGTELYDGKHIDVHPSWVSKFHGHGLGAKLYLPETLSKRDYIRLADYMYREVKRINRLSSTQGI